MLLFSVKCAVFIYNKSASVIRQINKKLEQQRLKIKYYVIKRKNKEKKSIKIYYKKKIESVSK